MTFSPLNTGEKSVREVPPESGMAVKSLARWPQNLGASPPVDKAILAFVHLADRLKRHGFRRSAVAASCGGRLVPQSANAAMQVIHPGSDRSSTLASPGQRFLPRIVIDLEKVRHINCGLGRFSLYLGQELIKVAEGRFVPVFLLHGRAPSDILPDMAETLVVAPWHKESVRRVLRPAVTPLLRAPTIALWHVTNQMSKYLPLDSRIPTLLTIHDLNFLHESQESPPTAAIARKLAELQRRIDRATAMTAVSEATARDIREHLDVRGKPIHVVHNGMLPPPPASERRPSFVPAGPFLFTLCNALPHKNVHVLLGLMNEFPGMRLVIAGKKTTPYGRFVEQEIERTGLGDRVIMPGEVSDGDRQWLYENCEAFVFPSLAEGFGFPVLEAMQAGRPAFMSRRTSLPEIAGPCGFFFDSYEPKHMADVLRSGLDAVRRDAGFADRARAHAATFTWSEAARRYAAIYDELVTAQLPVPRIRCHGKLVTDQVDSRSEAYQGWLATVPAEGYDEMLTPSHVNRAFDRFANAWRLKRLYRIYRRDFHAMLDRLPDSDRRNMLWLVRFGDVSKASTIPLFTKTRPIASPGKGILLNLNTNRHWGMIRLVRQHDRPWHLKDDVVFWRGQTTGTWRVDKGRGALVAKHAEPTRGLGIDVGINKACQGVPVDEVKAYMKPKAQMPEMLQHKYLISVEGNDVASNLKWAMASNSLVLMPPPTIEGWFLESRLEPWVHYVPLRANFGDLEERCEWCRSHQAECREIVARAQEYVASFFNPAAEDAIIERVLRAYVDKLRFVATDRVMGHREWLSGKRNVRFPSANEPVSRSLR